MRIDARLEHAANIFDAAKNRASDRYTFDMVGGGRGRVEIPRETSDNPKHVLMELRAGNADVPIDRLKAMKQVERAIAASPKTLLTHCAMTGWRTGWKAFVTPVTVIDGLAARRRRKLLPPKRVNSAQTHRHMSAGDLEGWKEIPRICGWSDLGMTAMAIACTPPLLRLVGRGSFGVHIYGTGKTGKSLLLVAASSLGGPGEEEFLPSWQDSTAARGEQCRLHNDLLLPLNEAANLEATKAREVIRKTVFFICEGRVPDLHTGSAFATTDVSGTFRTVFLSSSEHPLDYYAARANENRDDGERARCLEARATCRGRSTVIDRFPVKIASGERADWARRQLRALRVAAERNHCVAAEPLLRSVMEDVPGATERVRTCCRWFVRRFEKAGMSGAARHALDNAALIFAGGCVGIDAKLLPYHKRRLATAIWNSLGDSIDPSDVEAESLRRCRRLLRDRLADGRIYRLRTRRETFSTDDFDGYVRREGGERIYAIRARVLRSWFDGEPGGYARALEWLESQSLLMAPRSRSPGSARKSDWAEGARKWPDGRLVRSIEFRDPFA